MGSLSAIVVGLMVGWVTLLGSEVRQAVDNGRLRVVAERGVEGYERVSFFVHFRKRWVLVARWQPLVRIVYDGQKGEVSWQPPLRNLRIDGTTLLLTDRRIDPDGANWVLRIAFTLAPKEPLVRVCCEWQCDADRSLRALWGPDLLVGDNPAKLWGLLPGVEFLYDGESSSNPRDFAPPLHDRRSPNPKRLTIPLIAITIGKGSTALPEGVDKFFCPDSLFDRAKVQLDLVKTEPITVSLFWDPLQKWDGVHTLPSVRFESPSANNDGHRMALFLPSCPDFVPENAEKASKPYPLPANRTLWLEANIAVDTGHILTGVRRWLSEMQGLPKPNLAPRSFEQQLALDRHGFLHTVWDPQTEKWRHCVGWAPHHTPGFATLLWFNAHLTEDKEGREQALARVHQVARNMLRDGGAGLFVSPANCHIMRWEFPFHYGYLPEAMQALEASVRQLMASQQPDGSWRFHPADDKQATLGRKGDAVVGTIAYNAAMLLRYARITGDADALRAGEKALLLMEQFRVPRGGQTWECPMYEPDILPAGWAVAAYLEAFWVTGNLRWLHNAIYWAETGVPFVYLWQLPDRPMMLGAVIPVFGSTFYTHSWLGMPVQWCGLVYAYHVQRLAKTLEKHRPKANGSPLPLSLRFTPADWRRLAELITVSAQYQQFDEGELKGTYPDSLTDFVKRNPAFINPEDIAVNVLALKGFDPDIQTVRVRQSNRTLLISSGALIEGVRQAENRLLFRLHYFVGENSHTLLVGLRPRSVWVDGKLLPTSQIPVQRQTGWWWDEQRRRAYLVVPHHRMAVTVELRF